MRMRLFLVQFENGEAAGAGAMFAQLEESDQIRNEGKILQGHLRHYARIRFGQSGKSEMWIEEWFRGIPAVLIEDLLPFRRRCFVLFRREDFP